MDDDDPLLGFCDVCGTLVKESEGYMAGLVVICLECPSHRLRAIAERAEP